MDSSSVTATSHLGPKNQQDKIVMSPSPLWCLLLGTKLLVLRHAWYRLQPVLLTTVMILIPVADQEHRDLGFRWCLWGLSECKRHGLNPCFLDKAFPVFPQRRSDWSGVGGEIGRKQIKGLLLPPKGISWDQEKDVHRRKEKEVAETVSWCHRWNSRRHLFN